MRFIAAVVTAALGAAAGCAHQSLQHQHGCWVRKVESRWGDTREDVVLCEPRAPAWSADPVVRSVETCLYQAQMAWYTDAVQRLRLGKEVVPLPYWNGMTARCLADAQRIALSEVDKLKSKVAGLEERARQLVAENAELRDTLVKCVERTPNAVAHATATTESTSDASGTGAGSGDGRSQDGAAEQAQPTAGPRRIRRTSGATTGAPPATPAATTRPAHCPPVPAGTAAPAPSPDAAQGPERPEAPR